MKPPDFAVTFLDLVFSLFASVTMLIILLSATRGSDDYELKGDFLVVRIYWREEVRTDLHIDQVLLEPRLESSDHASLKVLRSTDNLPSERPSTVLVLPSVEATEYCLVSQNSSLIDYVIVTTRLGERRYELHANSSTLCIATEPSL